MFTLKIILYLLLLLTSHDYYYNNASLYASNKNINKNYIEK